MTFESGLRDLDLHKVCNMALNNEQQQQHNVSREGFYYICQKH